MPTPRRQSRGGRPEPWRGVSLGGWLHLEPGPADPLFEQHPDPKTGEEVRCEWDLMEVLRASKSDEEVREVLKRHRDTHITRDDFVRIKACGLNAVRLPFGYWILTTPSGGDIYEGPAVEYIERALDWAEELGLQVMLDLHGCPGGESGEAPCGRRQRPNGTWRWQQWRFDETLDILEAMAKRFANRRCVTGISVCNEPSNEVPLARLCQFYDRAVQRIRRAGMPASRVAVVLPCFQRPEDKFWKRWQAVTGGKHGNICMDMHCYHCFENEFHGKSFAQQLRAVQANAEMLKHYPMVVGEWSLALGVACWATCGGMEEAEVHAWFGRLQVEAFKEASHGHFFWNWTERKDNLEWNYQMVHKLDMVTGPPPQLPMWDMLSEDPLEEVLHPSPLEARILYGEKVWLRTFYGRYLDVYGANVSAQWPEKGKWQALTFCSPGSTVKKSEQRPIRDGDAIILRAFNGRYISNVKDKVVASQDASKASQWTLHTQQKWDDVRHRGIIYLKSSATGNAMDANEDEDGLFVRFPDFGEWQSLAVEKEVSMEKLVKSSPTKLPKGQLAGTPTSSSKAAPKSARRKNTSEVDLESTPKRQRQLAMSPSPQQTSQEASRRSAGKSASPKVKPARSPEAYFISFGS